MGLLDVSSASYVTDTLLMLLAGTICNWEETMLVGVGYRVETNGSTLYPKFQDR